ncbi:hypothetical protein C8J57DRAFT_1224816 [Mycena rebaudengoi]|nr:hypothetical protein C8J57DRAFT_1224816 [Mycena rebaudengoi]
MFSKLSVIVTSVLITLAAATNPPTTPQDSPQCCDRVVSSTDSNATAVAALVGTDLTGLDVPIGLSCSCIHSGFCDNHSCGIPLICAAPFKQWGGLIAINCIPNTL